MTTRFFLILGLGLASRPAALKAQLFINDPPRYYFNPTGYVKGGLPAPYNTGSCPAPVQFPSDVANFEGGTVVGAPNGSPIASGYGVAPNCSPTDILITFLRPASDVRLNLGAIGSSFGHVTKTNIINSTCTDSECHLEVSQISPAEPFSASTRFDGPISRIVISIVGPVSLSGLYIRDLNFLQSPSTLRITHVESGQLTPEQLESGQLSVPCNSLPPSSALRFPEANRPMILGSNEGNRTRLIVFVEITPPDSAAKFIIAARQQGMPISFKGVPVTTGGGPITLEFDADTSGDALYEIVGGISTDGDLKLTTTEVSTVFTNPSSNIVESIRPIPASAYISSYLTLLSGRSITWGFASTLIRAFAQPFTSDPVIRGSKRTSVFLSSSQGELTHPTGQQWNANTCSADAWKYSFIEGEFSEAFANSCQLAAIVVRTLSAHRDEVIDHFRKDSNSPPYTFPPWRFKECVGNERICPSNLWMSDNVLCTQPGFRYGVGNIDVEGQLEVTVDKSLSVSHLKMSAAFEDYIDFDIRDSWLIRLAAKLQAGFPTLGKAGRTFFVEVKADIDSTEYDFYPGDRLKTTYTFH
jgi:hypothetical protein